MRHASAHDVSGVLLEGRLGGRDLLPLRSDVKILDMVQRRSILNTITYTRRVWRCMLELHLQCLVTVEVTRCNRDWMWLTYLQSIHRLDNKKKTLGESPSAKITPDTMICLLFSFFLLKMP